MMMELEMEPILIGVLAVILGLINVFAGFRIFRVLLALSFLFVGYVVGQWLAQQFDFVNPAFDTLVPFAVAALMAGAAWSLFSVAVYLAGALFGISLLTQIGVAFGVESLLLFILGAIGAMLGGALAAALKKPAVILGTAFIGASLVMYGADAIFGLGIASSGEAIVPGGAVFGIWLLLAVTGAFVQYQQSEAWRTREDFE